MNDAPGSESSESTIERYLDGSMNEDEVRALEQRIASDPSLARTIEAQRNIDASLWRLFRHGAEADAVDGLIQRARERSASSHPLSRRVFAVAASLAILAVAGWQFWRFAKEPAPRPYASEVWRSMETVYHDVSATGFESTKLGTTNDWMARLLERRFGQAVAYREVSDDIAPRGMGFCNTISPQTACLVAQVEAGSTASGASGHESKTVGVLVFIDREGLDAGPALPSSSDLHVHRRIIGRLALYEVSPLDHPTVLDLLYSPSAFQQ